MIIEKNKKITFNMRFHQNHTCFHQKVLKTASKVLKTIAWGCLLEKQQYKSEMRKKTIK